jgi:hypothetical protein
VLGGLQLRYGFGRGALIGHRLLIILAAAAFIMIL